MMTVSRPNSATLVLRLAVRLVLASGVLLGLVVWAGARLAPSDQLIFLSSPDRAFNLFLMDVNRSLAYQLSDQPVVDCCLSWSPDGKQIGFMRRLGLNNEVFLMNLETRAVRQITRNSGLVMTTLLWSPDSERFLGVPADASNRAMYLLDSSSGQRENFNRNSAYGLSPQWSPDGQHVAFILSESQGQATVAVSRGDNTDIYVADSAGEHLQSVTQPGRTDLAPVWSPDGQQLAFVSIAPNDTQIYLTDLAAGQPRQITHSPGEKWGLVWSPNGESLVFLARRKGEVELYRVDFATGIESQLTHNAVWEWRVTWSPDGRYLLYEANPGGHFSLYLVELATLSERELSIRGASTNHWSVWKPKQPRGNP